MRYSLAGMSASHATWRYGKALCARLLGCSTAWGSRRELRQRSVCRGPAELVSGLPGRHPRWRKQICTCQCHGSATTRALRDRSAVEGRCVAAVRRKAKACLPTMSAADDVKPEASWYTRNGRPRPTPRYTALRGAGLRSPPARPRAGARCTTAERCGRMHGGSLSPSVGDRTPRPWRRCTASNCSSVTPSVMS